MGKPARRGRYNTDRNHDTTKGERRDDYRDRMSRNARDRKARNGTTIKEGYGEIVSTQRKTFKPLNDRQRVLVSLIKSSVCTFVLGPPGTGKSFVTLNVGCELLLAGLIDTLVCLKPATEIDSELGILPGGKDEKLMVLYNPMRQILIKILGKRQFENFVEQEKIIFEPLGSVLGLTYDNAFMAVDESQYITPGQMKIILTRLGRDTKVVICGDYKEQRFEDGISGMEDAYRRLRHKPTVGTVEFDQDDIVRSGFTKDVILAYRENIDE